MSHAAYPTIDYNSSTGSDTNPSDCVASSVGTSVTAGGTASGTTITFDFTSAEVESLDLSACADDDSDYIYCATVSGDRHLFQITAFSPSAGACTSITVTESIDADFTGAAWHVNGTRPSFNNDSSNPDERDWRRGWHVRLDGAFTKSGNFRLCDNENVSAAVDDPPLTLEASPNASSRPSVQQLDVFNRMIEQRTTNLTKVRGIKFFHNGAGHASLTNIYISNGTMSFVDCVLENTGTTQPQYFIESGGSSRVVRLFDCYVRGGDDYVMRVNSQVHCIIDNCWFDCRGVNGTTAAVLCQGQDNVITNTLVSEASGMGLQFSVQGSVGRNNFWFCKNNTVVDCGSHGIGLTGTPTATTSPAHTFYIVNNLVVGNGGYGANLPATSLHVETSDIDFNCLFNNTSGGYNGPSAGPNDVTITTTPFTDAANDDYSLNATATGGALLIGAARMTLPTGS